MKYSCVRLYCVIHKNSLLLNQHNGDDALQKNFYNEFVSCLYMFRAHVLIVRRSKLYYTASGIIILKQVSGLKLRKILKLVYFMPLHVSSTMCSSSGGQNCTIHPLVSSH